MFCQKCGASMPDNASRCPTCGAQSNPAPSYVHAITDESQLPEKYRPLGAWSYFGLSILFSIPIVGFIFLIVFACSPANINRRSYARSFFCVYILAAIILSVFFIAGGSLAALSGLFN